MPETSMPVAADECPVWAETWLTERPPASVATASRRRVVRSGVMSRPEIWSWQCVRTHCPPGSIPGGETYLRRQLLSLPKRGVEGGRGGLAVPHDIASQVDGLGS